MIHDNFFLKVASKKSSQFVMLKCSDRIIIIIIILMIKFK